MQADKKSVTRSIKIARGQLDGVLRMIEEDRYCVDIFNQLLATQAILKRVNREIMHAHIRGCVREGLHTDEPNPKLEEALELLDKLIQ
jgi:DNA-binding FrmR family transcriptional regulator